MFQSKARRIAPVFVLFTVLSLAPLADASAARSRAIPKKKPARALLLAQLEAQLSSFWGALQAIWGDAGVRMDDNG